MALVVKRAKSYLFTCFYVVQLSHNCQSITDLNLKLSAKFFCYDFHKEFNVVRNSPITRLIKVLF
jgi:hypothetical protein